MITADEQRQRELKQEAKQLGLTVTEYIVHQQLAAEGFSVLRNGWPDFLAVRNGKLICVEVKTPTDGLRPAQIKMHEALRSAGIEVRVMVV